MLFECPCYCKTFKDIFEAQYLVMEMSASQGIMSIEAAGWPAYKIPSPLSLALANPSFFSRLKNLLDFLCFARKLVCLLLSNLSLRRCLINIVLRFLREAPCKDTACSNGILPNSISTHPPSSKQTLCGRYFRKFVKTAVLTSGIDILTMNKVKHDS